jgi:glutaminyl-peptide cyclotransferase
MTPKITPSSFQLLAGRSIDNRGSIALNAHFVERKMNVHSLPYFFLFVVLVLFLFDGPHLQSSVEMLRPLIVARWPHTPDAFTQGLAVEGHLLYESTGLYGQSSLRCLDLTTGRLIYRFSLAPHLFAEGIALFSDRLIQLTWRERRAFVYQRPSLKLVQTFLYQGEGWGLCRDGDSVWMSNGTSLLVQRDQQTFKMRRQLVVRWSGHSDFRLNDLECVGDSLYANVWLTHWIIRINKHTGEVTGCLDASQLLSEQERKQLGSEAVLNGIAFRPETSTFFVTGKLWPWIFELRFYPASFH